MLLTAQARWWFHMCYGWQAAPCTGLEVLCEVSLDFGVAALLASVTPLYKMLWVPHQSLASLGVPSASAGVPRLGEPDLTVPGTPKISICSSFTHTYTTHVYTRPSCPFTHSHSLPFYLDIYFSNFFLSVGLAYLVFFK